MPADRAESYARMKVEEHFLNKGYPPGGMLALLERVIADAVRYGQALGPHKEPPPNPEWHPGMGGACIR